MDLKERILMKADELFMQYGFRAVSMDEIANNLGMSKKTLYQHFDDKDELVDGVMDIHIKRSQENCIGSQSVASNAIHEIFIVMDYLAKEFQNMNAVVVFELEKFHHKTYRHFQQHKEKFLWQVVEKNLKWGIKDELYRDDINVDVMCKFRLESMMIAFNVSLFPPGKYRLVDISEEILKHFTYGLATIKGHKLIQKYNDQRNKNKTI